MATQEKKEVLSQNEVEVPMVEIGQPGIEKLIYVIRDKQVMVDSDLAILYQVETGALNRAVKRNIKRFPEDFRFQLTVEEYENLKCQSGISSMRESGYGGRKTLPYVFTEQGISMLASVLHSEVAVNVSIGIMRAFVEMRRFIANNALLLSLIHILRPLRQCITFAFVKRDFMLAYKYFERVLDLCEDSKQVMILLSSILF